eukprot:GILJ01007508.1.p1 GENE.GILJ01007508.1~~GILJ01007508.1.p1  ORF type:complete len:436 (-),score=77.76 GILJ01007508.1:1622-2929(-)
MGELFSMNSVFMSWVFVLVSVCLLAASGADDTSNAVVTLTDENFASRTSSGLWIVDFYAPWCGHCKRLEPIFEEAAKANSGLQFGKVDATEHKTAAGRFNVKGYPTLKFMRDGVAKDYLAGRKLEDFNSFIARVTGPPVQSITPANLATFKKRDPVSFLLFAAAEHVQQKEAFSSLAKSYMDSHSFGVTDSTELLEAFGLSAADMPVLRVLGDDEAEGIAYRGSIDLPKLEAFFDKYQFPLFPELTSTNFRRLSHAGKKLAMAIVKKDDSPECTKYLEEVKSLARRYRDGFRFGWLDGVQWSEFIANYGLYADELPRLLIIDAPKDAYWEDAKVHSVSDMDAFLKSVEEGNVSPAYEGVWGMFGRGMKKTKRWTWAFLAWGQANPIWCVVAVGLVSLVCGGIVLCCVALWREEPLEDEDADENKGDKKKEDKKKR